jgi:16S rRNA (cytosine1402-N4)-methyltransferase
MAELFHDPIMVDEILHLLDLHPGDVVVDGTLGLAGHSLRFSEKIAPNGILYGFDWDQTMLNEARKRLEANNKVEIRLFHADFREIARILATDGIRAQGILLDLGFNSAQIDDPERGMSFKFAAPLDMRLDQSKGPTAEYVVNTWSVTQLEDCLFNLADEQWARAIAKSIVARRAIAPLRTTTDLVDCVLAAVPAGARDRRIHPATRTFQAIRLAVSSELNGLEEAIGSAADALAPGGTITVLSFHSGEDRATKQAFRARNRNGFSELTRKPLSPSAAEISRNPRSRSAKLRALRRDPSETAPHGRGRASVSSLTAKNCISGDQG